MVLVRSEGPTGEDCHGAHHEVLVNIYDGFLTSRMVCVWLDGSRQINVSFPKSIIPSIQNTCHEMSVPRYMHTHQIVFRTLDTCILGQVFWVRGSKVYHSAN
jgi:hypothetical protein